MKTARIVLAIAMGIALNITAGLTQASAQTGTSDGTKPPKPPKPPKSDDKHPKPLPIQLVNDSWTAKVPATRTALTSGALIGGIRQAPCSNASALPAEAEAVSAVAALVLESAGSAECGAMLAARGGDATAFRTEVVASLTEASSPAAEAAALADAVTGILSRPKPTQLAESVDRFNKLVMAAPDSFLSAPPAPFLAIHAILQRLLGVEKAL